jgi:extracellular elastinolytic metalloproteinase
MARDDHPASNVLIQLPSGKTVNAHQFQLRDDKQYKWIQVSVDAATGQTIQVVDYYSDAVYDVVALPREGPLGGFSKVTNPENSWSSDGKVTYTDTQSNNADSMIGADIHADSLPGARPNLDFDTAWDATKEPSDDVNKRAAIINSFYVANMMHDISYQYGFVEAAGNFQRNNFGKGGSEFDRVIIRNQGWSLIVNIS